MMDPMDPSGANTVCNSTNLPSFVLMINTFRIIVLTYNRPRSLHRLLKSLENSDYNFTNNNPSWRIILEIRVDGDGGEEGDWVKKIADRFQFSHGEKIVHKEKVNLGIMGAWRHAWSWRDRELFIVIEDDVEMSPHWYRAAVNMWRKYGDREYFGGLGLQNQEFTVSYNTLVDNILQPPSGGNNLTSRVRGPVYLYEVPSSIGNSPHPCHWHRMIMEYGERFGKCPEGMSCDKGVWEAWWLQYLQDHVLYTMYAAHKDAYALDHREVGYHHQEKGASLCSTLVSQWQESGEMENLPHAPDILDMFLQRTNKLGHFYLRKIWNSRGFSVVRLVTSEKDWSELVTTLPFMSEEEIHTTAVIISHQKYEAKLSGLRVLNKNSFTLVNESIDYATKDGLLLPILTEITSYAQKIITLPNTVTLADIPQLQDIFKTFNRNLMAGRTARQKHPKLDFLYFDGSFNTHNTIKLLYREHKQALQNVTLNLNFLASFTNSHLWPHHITWDWMA